MTPVEHVESRRAALCFMAAGAALLIGARFDITWAGAMVALFRPNNPLSEALSLYYRQGQVVMGSAACIFGFLALLRPTFFTEIGGKILGIPRSGFLAAIFLTGLLGALATQWLLFENLPHVTDAISHDFQARILTEGRLYALRPPCPDSFFQHHVVMTTDGKWFSKYTPGHPVLLALGYWSKLPWLPVALCHALTGIVLFALIRRHYSEPTARWVSLLFVLSPLSTLLGASFMSHSSFLLFALLGMCGLTRLHDITAGGANGRGRIWTTATWTGFAWGWALITRPQDAGIAVLMVFAAMGLAKGKRWSRFVINGLRCVPGLLAPLLLLVIWNRVQYGTWFAAGYGLTQDRSMHRIYQASFGLHEGFTWRDAVTLMLNTGYRFDRAVLGWPFTLPIILSAALRRPDRRDLICLMAGALHILVYFFYDYYGLEFEARYYFNLLPIVLILLVRALQTPSQLHAPWRVTAKCAMLAVFFAHGVLHFWPRYIVPTYSGEYEEVSRAPYREALKLLQRKGEGARLLILIETPPARRFAYSSGFLHNDPSLQSAILFARYIPGLVPCLLEAFPDREVYIMDAYRFALRRLEAESETMSNLMYP